MERKKTKRMCGQSSMTKEGEERSTGKLKGSMNVGEKKAGMAIPLAERSKKNSYHQT